jgi:hypothetical protein
MARRGLGRAGRAGRGEQAGPDGDAKAGAEDGCLSQPQPQFAAQIDEHAIPFRR